MENTQKTQNLFAVVGQKFNQTTGRTGYHTLAKFGSKAKALNYASEMEEMLQQVNPDVRCDVVTL